MTPDDPRHGTYAGAMAHWKQQMLPMCEPCRIAQRRAGKAAQLDSLHGRPRTVNLGERAWRLIDTTSRSQFAAAVGMTPDKITRYHQLGPNTRVHRTTRDRILAAGAAREFWTPIGVQRRVRALHAIGYSLAAIARETQLNLDGVKRLARRDVVFVRQAAAAAVVATYDRLSHVPAPPSRSASGARRRAGDLGWASPLAWDDIDTDEHPKGCAATARKRRTEVDEAVVQRILNGDMVAANQAERIEVVSRWAETGRPINDLVRLTGWKAERYRTDAA